jgi:hypothetical protein
MDSRELRYRVTAALLQAGQPLSVDDVAAACGTRPADVQPILQELLDERRVVAGNLVASRPAPQYCWRERWQELSRRELRDAQHDLSEAVGAFPRVPDAELDVMSAPSAAFCRYVVEQYRPPLGKRFLVFLQCSVRRPFSSSPSHAAMRRAIRLATGADPRHDAAQCPVHVVVLASKVGPVPYELEDLYPASVRGGGVKHLAQDEYERVKPVLAQRLAAYMITHGARYERHAAFTHGRYGEVMRAAAALVAPQAASTDRLHILPQDDGPEVERVGESVARTYWGRYWIQLYLEVVAWLDPQDQARAARRLERCAVEYRW